MNSLPLSLMQRIDDALAALKADGRSPMDVVMSGNFYATFIVQGEYDSFDPLPKSVRGLDIVRVHDGVRSVIRTYEGETIPLE